MQRCGIQMGKEFLGYERACAKLLQISPWPCADITGHVVGTLGNGKYHPCSEAVVRNASSTVYSNYFPPLAVSWPSHPHVFCCSCFHVQTKVKIPATPPFSASPVRSSAHHHHRIRYHHRIASHRILHTTTPPPHRATADSPFVSV